MGLLCCLLNMFCSQKLTLEPSDRLELMNMNFKMGLIIREYNFSSHIRTLHYKSLCILQFFSFSGDVKTYFCCGFQAFILTSRSLFVNVVTSNNICSRQITVLIFKVIFLVLALRIARKLSSIEKFRLFSHNYVYIVHAIT